MILQHVSLWLVLLLGTALCQHAIELSHTVDVDETVDD